MGKLNCSMDGNMTMFNGSVGKTVHLAGPGPLAVKWWGLYDNYANVEHQSPPAQKGKYWGTWTMMSLAWLLLFVGAVVGFSLFCFFWREHNKHFKDMLVNMCDERARMLQHQFSVSMNHVHALAVLISTFHLGKQPSALDQKTFAEYTARTAFERPLMTGVAYAQKVLHSEREAFERKQGWNIKTMHSRELSPIQDEYAPTIFSQETIGYLVSLDMMSGEEDRENIIRTRASGKGVLTSPFRLLESNHLGVVLTLAVYKDGISSSATTKERIDTTAGYLGGAFDVELLVENLLSQLAMNEAIIVSVYDISNASMPLVMYGSNILSKSGLLHVSSLDFGDPFRKHEMHCRLSNRIPLPYIAIGSLTGILILSWLLWFMVRNAHAHVKQVEEDYRKMEELKVKAEAADIAKSQFLATVSHEIRTPMNGVLGMLQMLMDTELDATQQDFARTAQASGQALITLINEVLDQARIEFGRIELESVPFDLRAILDDVLSLFSGKTRDNGIELAVFVSDRVPEILVGDPGRFRQIIINLVGNSVKFTSRGHIFLCIHLWEDIEALHKEENTELLKEIVEGKPRNSGISPCNTLSGFPAANSKNGWDILKLLLTNENPKSGDSENLDASDAVKLFVSVEDTGVGIPLQAQQRIFMPFMQANSSTSRTYGGTGIGLSISTRLVELMKGEICFESKEDIGTTFFCTPVFKKCYTKLLGATKKWPTSNSVSMFKGMRILIVDGRPVRSMVAKYHLERLGLEVKMVHDRKLALESLLERPGDNASTISGLDLVLVDKDAWGPSTGLIFPFLLREVRKETHSFLFWRMPRMILLATSITAAESDKAKVMGYVETVIYKPLRASMIAACLQQVLGTGREGHYARGILERPTNLCSLLRGKKILVVDDNKVNRRVAAGALQKYGAHVECADSGKSAISMLRPPHRFDACFMDIQMPEMDGFEATRQIRSIEQLANQRDCTIGIEHMDNKCGNWHLPILAMTADVIQATHEECSRCGMDGYVSKPFEEEQLYGAVCKFFDSKLSSL